MVKQYQKTFIANIKKQHKYLEQKQMVQKKKPPLYFLDVCRCTFCMK